MRRQPARRPLTRREAAKVAGAAAVVAGIAPRIGSVRAASDQVAFGLIGAGSHGQYLIQRLNGIGSGRCVAICDVHEGNLHKAVQMSNAKPQACADYRQLLARQDVQAVIVATPLHTHFPITRDALLAGKHVFCEPPLVFKPQEIEPLRRIAAERSSQTLQVGFQRRYSQFYQTARQMASKGMLGEVTEIQAQWNRDSAWTMQLDRPRDRNWRLFREFSGGIAAELASHQIDIANWVFADSPEFVAGVGSLDWHKDGRDIYDTVSLILKYPAGRKLICSYSSMSRHLPCFGGTRSGPAEVIMGSEGSIEITVASEEGDGIGMWFYEPPAAKLTKSAEQKEIAKIAGATVGTSARSARGFPILFARDQISGNESFFQRELKYARRWLYSKGIMVPSEDRSPVDAQLDGFFESCRTGRSPKADLDAGLDASVAVMLSNLAMDEGRRVNFTEMAKLSKIY